MLVWDLVLDVLFVISIGCYLVLGVIHFTAKNQEIIVLTINSPRCECHAAPTILLCFGQVAPTIILI
jgi:hypothetical protein